MKQINTSEKKSPEKTDNLWQKTCNIYKKKKPTTEKKTQKDRIMVSGGYEYIITWNKTQNKLKTKIT